MKSGRSAVAGGKKSQKAIEKEKRMPAHVDAVLRGRRSRLSERDVSNSARKDERKKTNRQHNLHRPQLKRDRPSEKRSLVDLRRRLARQVLVKGVGDESTEGGEGGLVRFGESEEGDEDGEGALEGGGEGEGVKVLEEGLDVARREGKFEGVEGRGEESGGRSLRRKVGGRSGETARSRRSPVLHRVHRLLVARVVAVFAQARRRPLFPRFDRRRSLRFQSFDLVGEPCPPRFEKLAAASKAFAIGAEKFVVEELRLGEGEETERLLSRRESLQRRDVDAEPFEVDEGELREIDLRAEIIRKRRKSRGGKRRTCLVE